MTASFTRPLKGSRISSFYPVKAVPPLSSLESAFQLQEYISLLIRHDIHDVDAIVSIPDASRDGSEEEKEGREVTVDEACWIYEQLRRLAQDLSHPLITMLQQECTRQSCPEMKAGEWLYLCVAHGNEGSMEQCCAIDYILHTVDSATALLNSPRAFPSRLSIPPTSNRHFSSLARRLGRIFAHAFFHHREIFEQAEAESSLYARFLALTSRFDLVPPEFLVIPPRLHPEDTVPEDVEPPRLLAAAVEPHAPLSEPEFPAAADPSPRKNRSRTDTMVFSEAYNMAEELARQDVPDVSPEESGEAGDELLESHPEAPAPGVPTNLEDAGVPLAAHEPESEEPFHASANEFPDSSVDPSLARSPELAEAGPEPAEGDVTEDADMGEPLDAQDVEEDVSLEDEHHEEADVTDEPLDLHEEKEHPAEADLAHETPASTDTAA
ncbi:unnamed protein product [Peniophora sp. CBMAI 1063]|nr:unnamed protein product [Peniophora sp. CBMAI 1063]